MTEYYKFLAPDGAACYSGTGTWPLPVDGQPGEWLPPIKGRLVPCERGYHVLQVDNLPCWVKADVILCAVEVAGKVIEDYNKHVARRARVTEVIGKVTLAVLVQWARDCAEHVSHLTNAADAATADAASVAAAAAAATADAASVAAAAGVAYAADAAAAEAADAAYTAAASVAYAAYEAASDAGYAAGRAAYDTYDAAYGAAYEAERRWQGERLIELVRGQRAP